jgi:hypothetical protein
MQISPPTPVPTHRVLVPRFEVAMRKLLVAAPIAMLAVLALNVPTAYS